MGRSGTYEVIEARNGSLNKQILRADKLGSDVVAHDLDGVACQDTVPRRGVEGIEDEDESNDCGSCTFESIRHVQSAADRPWDKAAKQHAGQGGQEHGSTAELVDNVGAPESLCRP